MDTKEGLVETRGTALDFSDAEGFARLYLLIAHSVLSDRDLEVSEFEQQMAARLRVSSDRHALYYPTFHWALFNGKNPVFEMYSRSVPEKPWERDSPKKSIMVARLINRECNGEMESVYEKIHVDNLSARIEKFGPIR